MAEKDLPRNVDAEESLIVSIILDNSVYDQVRDILKPFSFYLSAHKYIYTAIEKIILSGNKADLVTIADKLAEIGCLEKSGGGVYLAKLLDTSPVSVNPAEHAKIIDDMFVRRKFIVTCQQIDRMSNDKTCSIDTLRDFANLNITGIDRSTQIDSFTTARQLSTSTMDDLEARSEMDAPIGYPTGFYSFDSKINITGSMLCVVAGRPGTGKELTLCSEVLLHDGTFKKMRDIMIGDKTASIDGKKSVVNGVFPQGKKPVFSIEFSDGRVLKSGLEHQWEVMYRDWKEPRILNTKQLIEKLKYKRYQKRLYIPNHSGDFGINDNMEIHPYLLGVLLGDGGFSSSSIKITTTYDHIINKIEPLLLGAKLVKDQKITYRISTKKGQRNVLLEQIKNLNLFGKKSFEKFIPKQYLAASKELRLELIRGLIDTDGTVDKCGSMSYSTSSKQLAIDFQKLARSLGAFASMSSRVPSYKYKGEKKKGRLSYIIHISCEKYAEFVTIPYKKKRIKIKQKTRNLNVEKIKYIGEYECQCISVSHPRKLYLADDYIVTHNTAFSTSIIRNMSDVGVKTAFLSLEMDKKQIQYRWLCMETGIDMLKLDRPKTLDSNEWAMITRASSKISNWPVIIDDEGGLTIEDVERKCRKLVQLGCKVIFIDQLSKIRGKKGQDDFARYTENCNKIALLVKELKTPIFLLCQLNRNLEQRQNKEPVLSDLKMSGSIEEDADIVFLLFRPELYEKDENARQAVEGRAIVNLAKHRNGITYRDKNMYFDKSRVMYRSFNEF